MSQPRVCPFCTLISHGGPFELELIDAVVIQPLSPKSSHHMLVVPKSHYESLADLPVGDVGTLGRLLQAVLIATKHFKLDRWKIQMNGPGYHHVRHLHVHLLGG